MAKIAANIDQLVNYNRSMALVLQCLESGQTSATDEDFIENLRQTAWLLGYDLTEHEDLV